MDRRKFLTKSALIGVAGGTALATPAISQGKEKLTMVTTWGRGSFGVHDAAQRFADNVNAISSNLEIDLKANGELVSGTAAAFDAMSSGTADAFHAATYYYIGQNPTMAFFTAVPFGMTCQEMDDWILHNGGRELFDELGEEMGFKGFHAGNTGTQAGGWFRKEINSAADFEGLKYRMPGLGGKVISKMGASSITMAGGEIYQSLQSGAIDGAEWIGPASDESLGLQEATNIYYTAGFHEPGAALSVCINLDRWDGLSDTHKETIRIASGEANRWSHSQYLANNGAALERLIAGGTRALEFPNDVWDAFGAGAIEVFGENMGDDLFKRTYDSAMKSMRATSGWVSKSAGAYTAQRDRVMG
ncbi:MAG: ABC transporter substrate-binding protein [Rhodobacteraceae bacterium]|jgi:TRAP-type mannitol/chloroaromatic compound transport system substrate-binding protein|nr:ABC transporter substrate-binding protein [Paracoccaceae bacterium]